MPEETTPKPELEEQKIPYPRFKEVTTKLKEVTENLSAYQQYGTPEEVRAAMEAARLAKSDAEIKEKGYNPTEVRETITKAFPEITGLSSIKAMRDELHSMRMEKAVTNFWNHAEGLGVKVPTEEREAFENAVLNKLSQEDRMRVGRGDITPATSYLNARYGKTEDVFDKYAPKKETIQLPTKPAPPRVGSNAPGLPEIPEAPKTLRELAAISKQYIQNVQQAG